MTDSTTPSPSSTPSSQESQPAIPDWAKRLICWGTVILILFVGFVIYMVLKNDPTVSAFGKVATLLLVGLAAFIGLMGVLSFTSSYIGILDPKQPFGLPEGTVRAILTIAFIVLVGVLSGYLVTNSNGRSAFSADARIVLQTYGDSNTANAAAVAARTAVGAEGVVAAVPKDETQKQFEVVFYPRVDNRLSEDIAKQTLTMISTILAAMIGFYFAARGADERGDAGVRSTLVAEIQGELSRNDFQAEIDKLNLAVKEKKPTADEAKSKLATASKELVDLQVELDKIRDLVASKSALARVSELEPARMTLRGFQLRIDAIRGKIQNIN